MKFDGLPEFEKECRKIGRKYKSLSEDLQNFQNVLSVVPMGNSKHFSVIIETGTARIIKARLFCRYLKGSSLRMVYAYFEQTRRIEFIELYHKGGKATENRKQIAGYVKGLRP